MNMPTWNPWEPSPNKKYHLTHLRLGRYVLCMILGPEGYQVSIAGRRTRSYVSLDSALRAARRLLRMFLRDEILAAESALALLDEVKALPIPSDLAGGTDR